MRHGRSSVLNSLWQHATQQLLSSSLLVSQLLCSLFHNLFQVICKSKHLLETLSEDIASTYRTLVIDKLRVSAQRGQPACFCMRRIMCSTMFPCRPRLMRRRACETLENDGRLVGFSSQHICITSQLHTMLVPALLYDVIAY